MLVRIRRLDRLTESERKTLLDRTPGRNRKVEAAVDRILRAVRREGDPALRRYTLRFDGARIGALEVPQAELRRAGRELAPEARRSIDAMERRVRRFHRLGVPKGVRDVIGGVAVGVRPIPYATAGIYVPGGRAAYPSTVIMAAVPARLAGVGKLVLCTPPDSKGRLPAAVRYAAWRSGVDHVFRVGGAQAIAAMAYGTRSVPRVEILVGPGNAYVSAAKARVSGQVAVDFVAGPTEVLVVSDGTVDPRWLALDLAAQAEHDPDARAILITTHVGQAEAVARELEALARRGPREGIVRASLGRYGWVLIAPSVKAAVEFANAYAPEHLVLATRHPERPWKAVRNAGSVFLGARTACAFGDYGAGPNHILPTAGEAARRSALSVLSFVRFVPWQSAGRQGARRLARSAIPLARLEGLVGHARSMEARGDGR